MVKRPFQILLLLISFGLVWSSSLMEVYGPDYSFASKYDRTYSFYVHDGYPSVGHRLYVSVPPSLFDYYRSENHSLYTENDYPKFVTPNAVRSIAESTQSVISNKTYSDEEFANAVLMLVHQFSYVESSAKYPAETIVDNAGDCDVLSLLAASIMRAGGLDVVLFYYKGLSPRHMNVGVYLPYEPVYHSWWMAPTYYEYNGTKYWMAECTTIGEWKVGDQPELVAGAEPLIIPLENCEKSSPAEVASSLDNPLIHTSISINLTSENSSVGEKERALRISGSISPAYSGQSIVTYVGQNGSSWNTFRTVFTDDLGNYSLTWNFTSSGTYRIRTSWSGVSNYTGSDSETLTIFIRLSQPLDEFEMPEDFWYDNLVSRERHVIDAYKDFINQSVQEFLKINLPGTGVFLRGEFIILRSEQAMPKREQTITIPEYKQERIEHYHYRTRDYDTTITKWLPEQTITIPTPNIRFSLVLRNNGGNNYCVSVTEMDDSDISQIAERLDVNNNFLNASMVTRENTWYTVVARMSENGTTAELYDKNNALLKNVTNSDDSMSTGELGILITGDDTDTVIAFKNLRVETLDQPTPLLVGGNHTPVNGLGVALLAPYIGLIILLAVAVITVAYVKKRKRAHSVNCSFSLD
jgi:hypothetical protein